MGALETTFRMIKAETQLLYSSDYPHWDFDLPSTIYDLPFLSETAKRNILGGNAARLFGLELGGEAREGGVSSLRCPQRRLEGCAASCAKTATRGYAAA